jgi:hypothetical protein
MPNPNRVYQLEITLQDVQPFIRRRVRLEGDTTLAQLHRIVQAAMGWEDRHLWRFQLGGVEYGKPLDVAWDRDIVDAAGVRLCAIARAGDVLLYEYDFGDSWQHRIRVERVLDAAPGAALPLCVAATRACPPEDCGGPPGYEQLLEILGDPGDPEHDGMLAWVGGPFDPDAVDLDEINRRLVALGARRGSEGAHAAGAFHNPAEAMLGMVRSQVEQMLSAKPDASIDDLNAALGGVVAGYNQRPQADLGGLSPDQTRRLLSAEWDAPDGVIRLDATLALEELAQSRTLHNARLVLELLGEQGEVRATPKGNLPRAFIAAFHERMRWPAWEHAEWYAERKVLNEGDIRPLRTIRVLLELAGLMKRRKGRFSLTRAGARLTAASRAGELFATLFLTHFRRLNLAWLDGAESVPDFQHTIAFTLYSFGQVGTDARTPEALVPGLILPLVRENTPLNRFGNDPLPLILETRFLRPLEGFGLAEAHELPRAAGVWIASHTFRKTPLFDRCLSFDFESRANARR